MFFIGVFGIDSKEKVIRESKRLYCKSCNDYLVGRVVKRYNFFHFFFIPLIKWSEKYYVMYDNCNHIYGISREKGESIELDENIEITYWDLKEIDQSNNYDNRNFRSICNNCGEEVDSIYTYCPYCGQKLK